MILIGELTNSLGANVSMNGSSMLALQWAGELP